MAQIGDPCEFCTTDPPNASIVVVGSHAACEDHLDNAFRPLRDDIKAMNQVLLKEHYAKEVVEDIQ